MWRRKLLRIVVFISMIVLVGCKSNDASNGNSENVEDTSDVAAEDTTDVIVEDTTDVTAEDIAKEDVTLSYWDVADMKTYRNTVKMENPTPEKVLQLLTDEIEATGMKNRLPKKMIIDEVVIDENKIATVNVTLDEKDRGNYTTSAWAEAMKNTIVHTLIENESFGIDKVVFGDTLTEITTFADNIYFEITDGEVVAVDMR
ncbi:hypothetical protein [Anaerosporobacter sp.]|uniref:hypothetical protein n=1 Tax=Anaerosporobacter sp. TaxID=1872529 RepID=UPI0028A14273|nr:hypothetical protein [Anaerosporobacter sp.]